jgi:integrase
MSRKATGIEVRHQRTCPTKHGRRCTCKPTYRAEAFSIIENRRVRKSFQSLAAAKAWRADAQSALKQGTMSAARSPLLHVAAAAWRAGAEAGSIRNRSGDAYKPSAIRGYEQALRLRVLPALGALRVNEVRRAEVQGLVDRLLVAGHNPSTIRNTLLPLRAIFRRALTRGGIAVNPTTGLELPAVRGRRDRIATPEEAVALLGALERDRAMWATAMYAGLRLGELMALDWEQVDLDNDVIRVRWSYDQKTCERVAPKSRAGVRAVPVPGVLRTYLTEHRLATGRDGGLVFGRDPGRAFAPQAIYDRADREWKQAGLTRIRPHECRHTFASFMIAAGVNAKALSIYMGHSSVTITFDRYGHLMPGNEVEAASLLDAYLDRSRQAG